MLKEVLLPLVSASMVTTMLAGVSVAPASAQADRTVLDGVYTEDQADRGKAAVETHCASCHQNDLAGGEGPALMGERFLSHYQDGDVGALFNRIKTSMPRGNIGGLSDDMYIDVVAYILQMNQFPVGRGELSVNLARNIKVVGKGATGPVPDFSLVQVVGCLTQGTDNVWTLSNTSAPVRTRTPTEPAEADIQAAKAQALGTMTFRLLYVDTFKNGFNPADHKGHKMEGRGFLITKPDNRISITWLEMVDAACS
jgi:quinoprotein glucose dehydrogenase